MSKADKTKELEALRNKKYEIDNLVAEIEECIRSLEGFVTDLDYCLKDDSNIESTYYLKGNKYSEQTGTEKSAVKTAGQSAETKKQSKIRQLNAKVNKLRAKSLDLSTKITTLELTM